MAIAEQAIDAPGGTTTKRHRQPVPERIGDRALGLVAAGAMAVLYLPIMVLIIFTIMLLNLKSEEIREAPVGKLQVVILALLCAACAYGFIQVFSGLPAGDVAVPAGFGSIEGVGEMMLGDYLYPFEVISVLLLVAIAGVVLLAKRVI